MKRTSAHFSNKPFTKRQQAVNRAELLSGIKPIRKWDEGGFHFTIKREPARGAFRVIVSCHLVQKPFDGCRHTVIDGNSMQDAQNKAEAWASKISQQAQFPEL